ncbi:hypothetical protein BpHYR1_034769 [Brachionus plicatilis]|uniref:Uncharacterized protein n=1 Tax=Brachionus plicatilis TaxID=10195 RepID=A0A3M7S1U7_BRAPC|nr:hypothetical protein BpHYR1_034769 [Brachionus plicatilis]
MTVKLAWLKNLKIYKKHLQNPKTRTFGIMVHHNDFTHINSVQINKSDMRTGFFYIMFVCFYYCFFFYWAEGASLRMCSMRSFRIIHNVTFGLLGKIYSPPVQRRFLVFRY